MLKHLKEMMRGKFPTGCADALEALDVLFTVDAFTSQMALNLGERLAEAAAAQGEKIVVLIHRQRDGLAVFQYVSDNSAQRNLDFAMKKRETVLRTGHCSLWALAKELTDGNVDSVFCSDNGCLPVGGAFPIYVDGCLAGTVAISGLPNGKDHALVVDVMCRYTGKQIPVYCGPYI